MLKFLFYKDLGGKYHIFYHSTCLKIHRFLQVLFCKYRKLEKLLLQKALILLKNLRLIRLQIPCLLMIFPLRGLLLIQKKKETGHRHSCNQEV